MVTAFSIAITWTSEARSSSRKGMYLTLTRDTTPASRDTLPHQRDTSGLNDTTLRSRIDTFPLKISKDTLEAPINYEAQDSAVILVADQKVFLYGKTKTTYKDITLTAPRVEMDQQQQLATAYSSRDSTGTIAQRAQFEQGSQSFQSDSLRFDLKTQKALTQNTFTKQSEMFVNAKAIKKVNENTVFMNRAIMTTCDYDEPHFGFVGNRMKIINNKIAVTGPIHPEFEGVPIPIYLPFGIFPLQTGRHSGLLPPQFTVNQQYGLGLEGLGYYHVINDYLDFTLRGNLYSYGGWTSDITTSYRKRYRYSGLFNLSIQHTKLNFKGDPDFSVSNTFNISWSHSQDSKARPGTTFSANVNAGSTNYNNYIPNNPLRAVTSTQTSSIAFSKTWAGTPFNLTLSANENQNTNLHLINITLPDGGFTMSTIYPFQKREEVGTPRWYEKVGVGYSGVFRNQLAFYDTVPATGGKALTASRLLDTLQWGARHSFPISMSLPPIANGHLILSPGISYEQTWLTNRTRHKWDTQFNKIDTLNPERGLFVDQHVSFSLSASSALYGTFQFKHSRIVAIRHVIRPTFAFSYTPNMSQQYYDVIQVDSAHNRRSNFQPVSQFLNNYLFSGYSYGRFGGITFGLDNNVEMKWRSRSDTGEAAIKKIRLIDGFGFNSGYNFLQDSLRLLPFSLYFRSTIGKINITANGTLDPYQSDTSQRHFGTDVNRFVWENGQLSPGRLTNGSIAISTSFQSKTKDPNKQPTTSPQQNITDPRLLSDRQSLVDYMHRNPAEFVDFNIPWQVTLSYSLSYYRQLQPNFIYKSFVTSSVNFTGSFSLTPKWNFSTTGFFDFTTKQLTMFTMSISRDMHCWQMSINVTPIGRVKFFSIMLNPKASILQDLKVNRTRYFYNY